MNWLFDFLFCRTERKIPTADGSVFRYEKNQWPRWRRLRLATIWGLLAFTLTALYLGRIALVSAEPIPTEPLFDLTRWWDIAAAFIWGVGLSYYITSPLVRHLRFSSDYACLEFLVYSLDFSILMGAIFAISHGLFSAIFCTLFWVLIVSIFTLLIFAPISFLAVIGRELISRAFNKHLNKLARDLKENR